MIGCESGRAACDGRGSRPLCAAEPGRVNAELAVPQRLVASRSPAERRMI